MRVLAFILLVFLNGCQLVEVFPYSLKSKETIAQVSLDSEHLAPEDRQLLAKAFKAYGIEIGNDLEYAPFFIKKIHLEGHYQDLYTQSIDDLVLLNVMMNLDLIIEEKHSGRVLLDSRFKHQAKLIPHDDFYSHKNWYQAQVQYEGQQDLYHQAAYQFSLALKGHDKNT